MKKLLLLFLGNFRKYCTTFFLLTSGHTGKNENPERGLQNKNNLKQKMDRFNWSGRSDSDDDDDDDDDRLFWIFRSSSLESLNVWEMNSTKLWPIL